VWSCDGFRCFLSLHPAVLTFYIPSSLLIVFCTAIIGNAYCTLCRQSVMVLEQPCQEQVDAKLRLLSVTSSSGPSSDDDDHARSSALCCHRLTILTLLMVFGVFSWGSAAAAAVLERQTPAGTVAACFYAVCTSTVAVLLIILHPPTSTAPPTSRCSWRTFSRSGCLEQLPSWRNFSDRRRAGDVPRQPSGAVAKQLVYSIASSAPSAFHACTTPTIPASDEVNCVTDTDAQEVVLAMRDCTGSSCSVPVSLSVAQLPVSVGECKECRCCRSATDGSTDSRCLSRNSTRMRDFDDCSWSSDDGNYDGCPEGQWWNGEVDIDGCSIHRAPCPSPASACSSRATDYDEEDRCSESGLSQQHPATTSSSHPRCKRRWSVVGASSGTSKKTQRRRRYEDETEHIRYRRRQKTNHSQTLGTERVRSASIDRCSPGMIKRQKRRRISTKPRRNIL